jgi:hypothetical protein
MTQATVAAALTCAAPALADVTASEVWQNYKASTADMGVTMTATEESTAQGLDVRDIVMRVELSEEEGRVRIEVPELSITESGDGTVELTLPEVMPIVVTVHPAEDDEVDTVEFTVEHAHNGFVTVVSGSPEAMKYAYSAAESEIRVTQVLVDGEPMNIDQARISMEALAGVSEVVQGAVRRYDQTMTMAAMSYDIDVSAPEDATGQAQLAGSLTDLSYDSEWRIPEGAEYRDDMAAALNAGLSMGGTLSYATGESTFSVKSPGESSEGSSRSAGGGLDFSLSKDGLVYGLEARDVAVEIASTEAPFPIAVSFEELGFDLAMPVSASDAPQDIGLSLVLAGLAVPEQLWAMVDPGGRLPRDPATLRLDLAASGVLTEDVMDAQEMEALDAPPGELRDARVNTLELSVAGVELTGDGAFTFDNTDLDTFDGMPRPEGKLSLRLSGAHGLLDKLTEMGVIPEDQVSGMRMMLGLFAKPAGDDVLTSEIEVTPDGKVLANGERLK